MCRIQNAMGFKAFQREVGTIQFYNLLKLIQQNTEK